MGYIKRVPLPVRPCDVHRPIERSARPRLGAAPVQIRPLDTSMSESQCAHIDRAGDLFYGHALQSAGLKRVYVEETGARGNYVSAPSSPVD
jgi:hypothetical protein